MGDVVRVGLVTVTYNSAEVIDDFLRCVLAQDYEDLLLVVVDNASSDDTCERVRRVPDPRIRLIAGQENLGIAEGNNVGIQVAREAGCGFVLLINNDTEFSGALVRALVEGAQHSREQMVAPKILRHDAPERIWYAGGGFRPWLGYQPEHFGEGEIDRGAYDLPRHVNFAPACCLLVRMEVFDRIGVMDEQYFVYVEDVDFCYRAMRGGIPVLYLPSITMTHKEGSLTGGAVSAFSIRMGTRNRVYFVRKHMGAWAPLFVLAYFALVLTRILKRRDWKMYTLQLRAFFEGMKMPLPHGE